LEIKKITGCRWLSGAGIGQEKVSALVARKPSDKVTFM
jgi:hypothetical protein